MAQHPIALPVLSCAGCALCCREQTEPPYLPTELDVLPRELRRQIEQHRPEPDANGKMPSGCYWLGADGKCLHYDERPLVCREFEMGGEDCVTLRVQQLRPG
ncbi:MAG: YkgJ family cysteine cluster protein [Phycisphaerae bacterium]